MSDEAENELILDQKEDILSLVSHIFHQGSEDTVTEQLAKKIYTNIYLKAKKNDFQI